MLNKHNFVVFNLRSLMHPKTSSSTLCMIMDVSMNVDCIKTWEEKKGKVAWGWGVIGFKSGALA